MDWTKTIKGMAVKCRLTEWSHEDLPKDLVAEKPANIRACALAVGTDKAQFALALAEIVADAVDSVRIILDLRVRIEICQDKIGRVSNRLETKRGRSVHHCEFKILRGWSERKGTFSAVKVNEAHCSQGLL